ncbi:MAG: hypothetical protein WKF37_08255 [Bryobacteraceae bacterium]
MNTIKLLAAIALIASSALAQHRYSVSDEASAGPGSPAVVVLRDNVAGVEAAVAPSEGGELSSYRVKLKGEWIEFLYRARDYSPGTGFKGKAPLLWPAVGGQYPVGTIPDASCGEGTYSVAGKKYPMPCHGFARSLPWKETTRSADKGGARVNVQLRDSSRTRSMYPFGFVLDASYELAGGHLTINYTVSSDRSNTDPMVFSIGNHIAFAIPFVKGTNPADLTLRHPVLFNCCATRGVLSGEQKPRSSTLHEVGRLRRSRGNAARRVSQPAIRPPC